MQVGPCLSGVSCCLEGTAEAWTSARLGQQEVDPTQHVGKGPAAVQGTAGVLQGRQGGDTQRRLSACDSNLTVLIC